MITYADKEQARYWPVSAELMAHYNDGSHTKRDEYGGLRWYKNGLAHRDGDLPVWIGRDGSLHWYQNGQHHRDSDKPAMIWSNGRLEWYQNAKWHRICGPAVIYVSGRLVWCINGKNITKEVNEWLNGEEWQGTPEQIVEFQLKFT